MSKSQPKVYAFIDSQNLNLGVKACGWNLDFRKFRLYLRNKYNVSRAYLFIGQVAGNENLYRQLQEMGYVLVFKPATQYKRDGKVTTKGNVDAELVLYSAAILFDEYDQAIIVSGDGDFFCLIEYLAQKDKLLHVFAPNHKYSKLLRQYAGYIIRVDRLRASLATKKTSIGGRSKP